MPVMKVSWITSPLALAFAQKFLPEQTWVPFFNIVAFVIGTYINAHTKKKRLDALRRKVCSQTRNSGKMLTLFASIMVMGEALRAGLMTIRGATTEILTYQRYRRLVLVIAVLICVILGLFPSDLFAGRRPWSLIAMKSKLPFQYASRSFLPCISSLFSLEYFPHRAPLKESPH